jgi:hypothetical protein
LLPANAVRRREPLDAPDITRTPFLKGNRIVNSGSKRRNMFECNVDELSAPEPPVEEWIRKTAERRVHGAEAMMNPGGAPMHEPFGWKVPKVGLDDPAIGTN